jgi:hypothetical protein
MPGLGWPHHSAAQYAAPGRRIREACDLLQDICLHPSLQPRPGLSAAAKIVHEARVLRRMAPEA